MEMRFLISNKVLKTRLSSEPVGLTRGLHGNIKKGGNKSLFIYHRFSLSTFIRNDCRRFGICDLVQSDDFWTSWDLGKNYER